MGRIPLVGLIEFVKPHQTEREAYQDAMHAVYETLQQQGEASTAELYRSWPTTGVGAGCVSREWWEKHLLPALASAPGVTANLWRVVPEAALSDAELDAHLADLEVDVSRRDIHYDTAELNRDRIRGAYRALRDIGPLTHGALQDHADDNANVIMASNDANWRDVVLPTLAELPGVKRPSEEAPEWGYQRPEGETAESDGGDEVESRTAKYQTETNDQEPAHGVTL